MEQVLLVIHVIIAAALIGMVLLQRSETDGFGLGSGSGSNLLSGRAAANLMTRTTAILATMFIITSLVLSIMASRGHAPSVLEQLEQGQVDGPVAGKPEKKAEKLEKKAPAVPNVGEDVKPVAKKKSAKTDKGEE